jgi:hypothetical protein
VGAGSEQEEGARGGRHGSGGRTMKRSGNGTLRVEAPAAAMAMAIARGRGDARGKPSAEEGSKVDEDAKRWEFRV